MKRILLFWVFMSAYAVTESQALTICTEPLPRTLYLLREQGQQIDAADIKKAHDAFCYDDAKSPTAIKSAEQVGSSCVMYSGLVFSKKKKDEVVEVHWEVCARPKEGQPPCFEFNEVEYCVPSTASGRAPEELHGNTLLCSGTSSTGHDAIHHFYVTPGVVFQYWAPGAKQGRVYELGSTVRVQKKTHTAVLWGEAGSNWLHLKSEGRVFSHPMFNGHTAIINDEDHIEKDDGQWVLRNTHRQASTGPGRVFFPLSVTHLACRLIEGRVMN